VLAGTEQGNGPIDAPLPGAGAPGGGDGIGVIPPLLLESLPKNALACSSAASAAAKPAERVTCCGVSATVRMTRMGSPPFSPVAVRTAALMLIMCLPPITPAVFRYSYPLALTSGAACQPRPPPAGRHL
jgi:hypothetical protein